MTHRLGALQSTQRSFLVSRAIKIAKKKHGQFVDSPLKQPSVLPAASLAQLSDAVKFVTRFSNEVTPPNDGTLKTLASLMSVSLCSVRLPRLPDKGEGGVANGLTVLDLMELASLSRRSQSGDDRLSKEAYGELLKLCLTLINSDAEVSVQRPVVMDMVDHMIRDWGREEVRSTAYSSAFQASTSAVQVDRLYRHFRQTGQRPKLDKEVIVQAYLGTETRPRPSLSRLISQDMETVPSGSTLEQLVLTSATANQLQRCLGLYTCMTRRYRLTPSREVFSSVTRMLTQTLAKGPPQYWKLALISTLLTDTVCVFGGEPPLWIYSELATPLTHLLGPRGYEQMVEASGLAAQEQHRLHKETTLTGILRELWQPSVFYSLLHCARKTNNTTLALDMLSDMKALYLNQSKSVDWVRVFEKMLSLVRTHSDLSHYLPTVVEELTAILSKKQINALQDPLFSALMRAYHSKHSIQPVTPRYLFKASQLLINTAVQSTYTNKCIQDLAHYAHERNNNVEQTVTTDCDDVFVRC